MGTGSGLSRGGCPSRNLAERKSQGLFADLVSLAERRKVTYAISLADIEAAARRIARWVHRTPVMTCRGLDVMAGRSLFFKCENFQKVGAFKARGACNAVWSLPEGVRDVVTHSSGNFGQALAFAAQTRGIRAHVVMPTNATRAKRDAVMGFGGRVVSCAPTLAAREAVATEVVRQTDAVLVHPYDQAEVIAGQGTVALEVLEQVQGIEAIVAPVGGGGLVSGIALAVKERGLGVAVFAAEPSGADDAARSKACGRLLPQEAPHTIADGLRTSLGRLTWPVIRDLVAEVITVSDSEIVRAMLLVFERMKVVIEPSAAVAVAAVLSDRFRSLPGLSRVVVVLSGGNADLGNLPWIHGPSRPSLGSG